MQEIEDFEAQYLGDKPQVESFGYTFPKGKWVKVDKDSIAYEQFKVIDGTRKCVGRALVLSKLMNNREFEVRSEKKYLTDEGKKPTKEELKNYLEKDHGTGDA